MSNPDELVAQAHHHLKHWHSVAAAQALREAVRLYRQRGDVRHTCECLVELAGIGARTGDIQERREALKDATEAAEGFRGLGLRGDEGVALYWAAEACSDSAEDDAEGFYRAALPLLEDKEESPYAEFALWCHGALGRIAVYVRADEDTAETHYLKAWRLLPHSQSRLALSWLAKNLAEIALRRGQPVPAVEWLDKALTSLDAISLEGARREAAVCRMLLGEARQMQGDVAGARAAYELALRSFQHWGMVGRAKEAESRLRALP